MSADIEPEQADPTQCSGDEGFCPEHGFHRHSLKQPGDAPTCIHPDGYEGECPCPPSCVCCRATAATDQPTTWYEAGCARDCTEQHTYTWGRCALAPKRRSRNRRSVSAASRWRRTAAPASSCDPSPCPPGKG